LFGLLVYIFSTEHFNMLNFEALGAIATGPVCLNLNTLEWSCIAAILLLILLSKLY